MSGFSKELTVTGTECSNFCPGEKGTEQAEFKSVPTLSHGHWHQGRLAAPIIAQGSAGWLRDHQGELPGPCFASPGKDWFRFTEDIKDCKPR